MMEVISVEWLTNSIAHTSNKLYTGKGVSDFFPYEIASSYEWNVWLRLSTDDCNTIFKMLLGSGSRNKYKKLYENRWQDPVNYAIYETFGLWILNGKFCPIVNYGDKHQT